MSDSAPQRTTGAVATDDGGRLPAGHDGVHTQSVPGVEAVATEPIKRNVLAAVGRNGSLSPVELGETLGFTTEAMLRHCTDLEKQGRLTRRQPAWVRVTVEVPDWKLGDIRREARHRGFPIIEGNGQATSQDRPEMFDTFAIDEPPVDGHGNPR